MNIIVAGNLTVYEMLEEKIFQRIVYQFFADLFQKTC